MTAAQPDEGLKAYVHGRVQGVGYRMFAQRKALELGLKGYARNLSDGVSVEVLAEGSRTALESLVAALRQGPSGSLVERVDVTWLPASGGYQGFVAG